MQSYFHQLKERYRSYRRGKAAQFVHQRLQSGKWVAPWLRYQNMARYQWAGGFVQGRHVLEVGCGSGHGTKMLSDAGAVHVDGLDVAPESIRLAREKYGGARITFHDVVGQELPFGDASYDLVVSLETIEHVAQDDQFVQEIARVLRPRGKFLCSTPNRAVTNPGTAIGDRPFNRHHMREYTLEEFRSLLSQYFRSVRLLGQSFFGRPYVAALSRAGRHFPRLAVRLHQLRKTAGIPGEHFQRHEVVELRESFEPEVLVAICER